MKKLIIFLITSMFFFGQASAIGLNVGVSGVQAVFHAEGEDNENGEKSKEDATGLASYGSVFAEIRLNDFIAFGVDYVPEALESETSETKVEDITTSTTSTIQTNKVQVDFEELTSAYVMLNLTEGLYVRGGVVQVDVVTNESLGTGSTYDDTDFNKRLKSAWAVVNYSSNPAMQSVFNGVPVFVSEASLSYDVGNKSLANINNPERPDRQTWANQLAYTEWWPEEITNGKPWKRIKKQLEEKYLK